MEGNITDALMGPIAVMRLLDAFCAARGDAMVTSGIAQAQDNPRQIMVVVQVDTGQMFALTPREARTLAYWCTATERMPRIIRDAHGEALASLARTLSEHADEADAYLPERRH
jgi:hypothetical protein